MTNASQNLTVLQVNEEKPQLLTMVEASVFLNLKDSRLRYEVFRKRIPFYKIGRSIRFSKQDLIEWVMKQKQEVQNGGDNE